MPDNRRQGELWQGICKILLDEPEGLSRAELLQRLEEVIPPNALEKSNPDSRLGPWTIGLVKAGWLTKSPWALTERGRAAYYAYPDAETAQHEWNVRYERRMKDR